MEAQQIDSLMDAKPEEKGEIASNHRKSLFTDF